jgi:hypothetical protein
LGITQKKNHRSGGGGREAYENSLFSCRIKSVADVTTLAVQLNCLSGRSLFYKLRYASFGIKNNEGTIILKGEICWSMTCTLTVGGKNKK